MIYLVLFFGIYVAIICTLMLIEIGKIEGRAIVRQKILQDWLFNSLYSIDHRVLLPTELEKPMINRKARVYSPTEDGMAEFNGMKDDL